MKKDESEERISRAGKFDLRTFSPVSWPPPDSNDSRNQEMRKTFAGEGELKEHLTATYWG